MSGESQIEQLLRLSFSIKCTWESKWLRPLLEEQWTSILIHSTLLSLSLYSYTAYEYNFVFIIKFEF